MDRVYKVFQKHCYGWSSSIIHSLSTLDIFHLLALNLFFNGTCINFIQDAHTN